MVEKSPFKDSIILLFSFAFFQFINIANVTKEQVIKKFLQLVKFFGSDRENYKILRFLISPVYLF